MTFKALLVFVTLAVSCIRGCLAEEQTCDDEENFNMLMRNFSFIDYQRTSETALAEARHSALSITFFNLLEIDLKWYWQDGTEEGQFQGKIPSYGDDSCGTYEGQTFIFRHADTAEEVHRVTVTKGKFMYMIADENSMQSDAYIKFKAREKFSKAYYESNGIPYIHYFDTDSGQPRPKPVHYMWDADFVGQHHYVTSEHTYLGQQGPLTLELIVLSKSPRVLLVKGLLSHEECDEIVNMSKTLLGDSMVGLATDPMQLKTRTSKTGWIQRDSSPMIDMLYKRFGDVLKIPHDILRDDHAAESIQVVKYQQGQEYREHLDFSNEGRVRSRYLTLLAYLNEDQARRGGAPGDGGTSFPHAFEHRGMRARPPKGSAILFYSLLPDGNGDEKSQHAGLPVPVGVEKYVCNLWVWDPLYQIQHDMDLL